MEKKNLNDPSNSKISNIKINNYIILNLPKEIIKYAK